VSVSLFIRAVVDQFFHDGRVGERGGVAEGVQFVLGDLAQDAAHDLTGASFGQAGGELDDIGFRDRPDFLDAQGNEFFFQFIVRGHAEDGGDVGVDTLPLDLVRVTDHGGLGDLVV